MFEEGRASRGSLGVTAVVALLAEVSAAGGTALGSVAPVGAGSTINVPCSGSGGGPAGLVAAIVQADQSPGKWTIALASGCTYDLTSAYLGSDTVTGPGSEGTVGLEDWFGPSALPAIATNITIAGNGAVLKATQPASPNADTHNGQPFNPDFRFFFVGADPLNTNTAGYTSPGPGNLTLEDLTLTGGEAHGGDATNGGGGAGMGGAIFNQGSLTLSGVTATSNIAHGGEEVPSPDYSGGGGMGTDGNNAGAGNSLDGGGFGPGTFGGAAGGAGGIDPYTGLPAGGGGGGFTQTDTGGDAAGATAGAGGGSDSGLGGQGGAAGGDGSGGGGFSYMSAGGAFGEGALASASHGVTAVLKARVGEVQEVGVAPGAVTATTHLRWTFVTSFS